jgi:FkbM family methyltransferase
MKIKLPRFMREPPAFSHVKALERLRMLGFTPAVIYDVGAFHGGWTKDARKIFPSAEYILFEANEDNIAALDATGERRVIAVLAGEDGDERNLYLPKLAVATGASLYRERTEHYADDRVRVAAVRTRRLDTLAVELCLPRPDLIKLDVQGAELDVLAGAGDLLGHCAALVAELSFLSYNDAAPLIAQVIAGVEKFGFRGVDICEIHKNRTGSALQMDILFANGDLFERYRAAAGLT